MVDFGSLGQPRENQPVRPDGLARECYLPILATLAIQLSSYIGYVAILVIPWSLRVHFRCQNSDFWGTPGTSKIELKRSK